MITVSAYSQRDSRSVDLRKRGLSLLAAVIAHILIIFLLLRLNPDLLLPPADEPGLATFDVAPEAQTAARVKAAAKEETPEAAVPPPQAPRPVTPAETPPAPIILPFDSATFAASDISKLPNRKAEASGAAGEGEVADSGAAYGPGEGPGGEKLFNAEWQREPTRAELSFYLPAKAPRTGVALIACRTAERFRVENCTSLGETPPGSGLARAMREAAWQFRVLPPRIGGRAQIGAWVRIRIEFTESGLKP